jgi:hypothetical protein
MTTVDDTSRMNPKPQLTTARRYQRIGIVWLLSALLTLIAVYTGYRLYLAHKINVKIERIRQAGFPVTTPELNKWYAAVPPEENAALILINAKILRSLFFVVPFPECGSRVIWPETNCSFWIRFMPTWRPQHRRYPTDSMPTRKWTVEFKK